LAGFVFVRASLAGSVMTAGAHQVIRNHWCRLRLADEKRCSSVARRSFARRRDTPMIERHMRG